MYVLNGFLYNKRKKYLTKKIMKKSKRRGKSGSFEKILTCFSFASCLFIAHTLINDGQVCWHNFRSIFLCMATWYLFGSRNEKKTQLVQNSYKLGTIVSEKKGDAGFAIQSFISHQTSHVKAVTAAKAAKEWFLPRF